MRLTPAQLAMSMLLGNQIPMQEFASVEEEIQQGRALLKEITGKDYGYDVVGWHDYLLTTKEGGYTWANKHKTYDKLVCTWKQYHAWHCAVTRLQETGE